MVTPALRARLAEAAVAAARAVGYVNAGTVEFVVDRHDGDPYFLEMNTRLQVEHPVTEAVTGLDLVRLQLLIAGGAPLPAEVARRGGRRPAGPRHRGPPLRRGPGPATGCRRPAPSTGSRSAGLTGASTPARCGSTAGSSPARVVSPHYDPMLAKVIVHAPTRAEAASALAATLARARIHGVTTNRDLLVRTLRHPGFVAGETDTGFLDRHGLEQPGRPAGRRRRRAPARGGRRPGRPGPPPGRRRRCSRPSPPGSATTPRRSSRSPTIHGRRGHRGRATGSTGSDRALAEVRDRRRARRRSTTAPSAEPTARSSSPPTGVDPPVPWSTRSARPPTSTVPTAARPWSSRTGSPGHRRARSAEGSALAPMPGGVVRVAVAVGDTVEAGQLLVVLEAMKMEHAVHAAAAGTVTEVDVAEGDQVETGRVLVVVEPDADGDAGADGPRPAGRLMTEPLRIANCSGFYGDRLLGGPGDGRGRPDRRAHRRLAGRAHHAHPVEGTASAIRPRGWAHTFLTQMEEVLGTCVDRGIKVVTNAGGLNPAGLADQVRALADRLGLAVSVAHVEGDDLLPRIGELRAGPAIPSPTSTPASPWPRRPGEVVSANAYLGGWPIVEALDGGADVVVCPRITDASLVVGPGGLAPRLVARPTGTGWPGRWWPATSSSAAPRPPGATTPSSPRCRGSSTRASPSPRWPRTARR